MSTIISTQQWLKWLPSAIWFMQKIYTRLGNRLFTIPTFKVNLVFFLYEKLLKLSPVFAQCLPILLCEVADPAILTPPTHPLFLKDGIFFFHLSALKDYLWRFYNLQQAFLPRHTQGALVAALASWRTCRTFLRQQKEPSVSRQQGSFLNPDTGWGSFGLGGSKCQHTF